MRQYIRKTQKQPARVGAFVDDMPQNIVTRVYNYRLDYARNRQEIRFLIASHYLDLCRIQNRQEVVERNISLTEKVLDNTKARHRQGTALKTDITRHKLQLEAL